MITLQELKDKISDIENQINEKGFSADEIYLQANYKEPYKDIELYFNCDGYYGVFVSMEWISN